MLNNYSLEIKDWRIDTTEGMGMFGLNLPIMILKGYQELHMASTYAWDYPYPTSANPLVDNNLLCAGVFRLIHAQFDLSRFEKTQRIIKKVREEKFDCPIIKVCDGQRLNNCCDDCSKCVQTMLALLALGEDINRYGFEISRQEAIERSKKYLLDGASFWVSWNIKKIIYYLKNLQSCGEEIPDDLLWLTEIDLQKYVNRNYVCGKTMVDWTNYVDLAPFDLIIPNYIVEKDL